MYVFVLPWSALYASVAAIASDGTGGLDAWVTGTSAKKDPSPLRCVPVYAQHGRCVTIVSDARIEDSRKKIEDSALMDAFSVVLRLQFLICNLQLIRRS
jgi:hypothetical protein